LKGIAVAIPTQSKAIKEKRNTKSDRRELDRRELDRYAEKLEIAQASIHIEERIRNLEAAQANIHIDLIEIKSRLNNNENAVNTLASQVNQMNFNIIDHISKVLDAIYDLDKKVRDIGCVNGKPCKATE
jgi:chromosome segregation ATPase